MLRSIGGEGQDILPSDVTMGSISKKAANADNVCHATPEKWLFWAPPEPRTQAGVESRFIPSFAENNT